MSRWNLVKSIIAEKLNRISSSLVCHDGYTIQEYQYWLDKYPVYHGNFVEKIKLLEKLNIDGTNDVFKAITWSCAQSPDGERTISPTIEIVLKIMIPYVPKGKDMHHRLSTIISSFYDEIRINNLVRSTNIEGVIKPFGGGQAGKMVYLKMEYIKGQSLDKTFQEELKFNEILKRLAKMAYLANTISQLHYYDIIHKDLKPRNLIICQNENHRNNHKILICDFGYANSRLRDTVSEYGGQLTPCYSAPEQAIISENLSPMVDYFSFGVILHEYLTGKMLFPESMNIFVENNYKITEKYLNHLKTGKQNCFDAIPEIRDLIDRLTTFDSSQRKELCQNLFEIAHFIKDILVKHNYSDINTEFLTNQLEEYKNQTEEEK